MDQLKEQLSVVLKYGFWIGSVLVLLGSAVLWYLSTSNLTEENDKRTSALQSKVTSISGIRSELSEHPNELSHKEMEALIVERQQEVLRSWQTLFERQQKILTWPDDLSETLLEQFEGKVPIEKYVEFDDESPDPTELTLRNNYARYIKNALPDIAKIARTEWTAKFDAGAGMMGMGGGMGMEMGIGMGMGMSGMGRGPTIVGVGGLEQGPVVQWSTGSQSALLSDLFPWRGSVPSTLEIYYSQENLWILKQLMQIIAAVNGDARQPYQADIHEIKRLSIGKSVQFGAGNISKPGVAGGGMEAMMMGMDMEMGMGMMEMDMGEMMGMDVEAVDPGDGRYVDLDREPIDGSTLRSALTSEQPSDVNLAVAKRVPVMMSLKMNQKAVPELLATCGSVPLMVEVQQVRLLPPDHSGGAGAMTGGMGMEEMGGMGMEEEMGGMGMGMDGMGGMGMGSTPAATKRDKEFPLDITVEVYGLIFIYNPPNRSALALEEIDKDTELSDGPEIVASDKPKPAPATRTNDVLPSPNPLRPADAAAATTAPATAATTDPAAAAATATPPAASPTAPAGTPPAVVPVPPAGTPPAGAAPAEPPPATPPTPATDPPVVEPLASTFN